MATMTLTEPGLARTFTVPLGRPVPGGPFNTGTADLVLEMAGAEARPTAVRLDVAPLAVEFQAWIPRLVEIFELPYTPFDLGRAAAAGTAVLRFTGGPAVLERVPAGLVSLDALADWLATGPAVFDLKEFGLASVDFRQQEGTTRVPGGAG